MVRNLKLTNTHNPIELYTYIIHVHISPVFFCGSVICSKYAICCLSVIVAGLNVDGEEPALLKDKLVDVLLRRFLTEPELGLTSAHTNTNTHTNISTHTYTHLLYPC